MAEQDFSQGFLFEHEPVRGVLVRLDQSLAQVTQRHAYPAAVAGLLGEALAAAALLSQTLKFDGRLSLQAQGKHGLKMLLAESTESLGLRAIAQYEEPLSETSFSSLMQDSQLAVTITPKQGQSYQGIVPLEGDTLGRCLEHYFLWSEQLDTHIGLFSDGHHAAGILLQRLPGRDLEDRDFWNRITQLAATLKPEEAWTLSAQAVLHRLFHEDDLRLFAPKTAAFQCSCSTERTRDLLKSLGQSECDASLNDHGVIEITCQFCNQVYTFTPRDINQLFGRQGLH